MTEADIYHNYNIPPLKQTLEEIRIQFQNHVFLKAVSEGRIVDSVRAYECDGTAYIGKLIVHPDYQNKGLGKMLMSAVEERFHSVREETYQ